MWKYTTRSLLGLLASSFWALSLFVWIVAGYVIVDYRNYDDFVASEYTLIPAVILLVIGIIFFFAGLIGWFAILRRNMGFAFLFGFLLLLLMIMLAVAGSISFVYHGKIESIMLNRTLDVVTVNYNYTYGNETNYPLVKQLDWLQQNLHCCGAFNYTDWNESDWLIEVKKVHSEIGSKIAVPLSCCRNFTKCGQFTKYNIGVVEDSDVFGQGCYGMFTNAIKGNLSLIGSVAIALVLLLLLGFISSCILIRIYKNEEHDELLTYNMYN